MKIAPSNELEKQTKTGIWIGFVACWIVCVGDFAVNFALGLQIPGYDFLRKTMSYLGRTGSPVEHWVKLWGVLFFVCFCLFANGWWRAVPAKKRLAQQSSWLLIIYGLGEGLGSGLLPFNKVEGHLTDLGLLHEIFSGIGDAALFIFPLLAMQLFTKTQFRSVRAYSWIVVALGLLLNMVFLCAKTMPSSGGIFSLSGLWQRLFLFNYYLYFVIITVKTLHLNRREEQVLAAHS